jgi:LPS sulfotransferase NodH
MLVGSDTGHEGKFDFPRRSGRPAIAYMLASVPRAGSSWLSHLLWRTGCLGAPIEYLNFDPAGPYFFAAKSASAQLQLWRSVLARRTSPNGVFGVKCFPSQLEALQQDNPELLSAVMSLLVSGPRPRVVQLERRDRVAQAISYARASLSGVWRKEQEAEGGERVDYSGTAVDRARQILDAQSAAWEEMFRELRVQPLRLTYEDALADPEGAVRKVAAYLGVEIDPAAQISVPAVEKQSSADSEQWAKRYAASGGV